MNGYHTLTTGVLLGLMAAPQAAALQPLSERALSEVTGREGLSMVLQDFSLSGEHTVSYYPDPNSGDRVELRNLRIDDGSGGTVTLGSSENPLRLDFDGERGLSLAFPQRDGAPGALHLGVEQIAVNDFALGALEVSQLSLNDTVVHARGHGGGISLGLSLGLDVGALTVAAGGGSGVRLGGLHIGADPGPNTDPRLPEGGTIDGHTYAPWNFSGGWKLADVNAYPLQIDVASCTRDCGDGGDRIYISMNTGLSAAQAGYIRIRDIALPETANFSNQLNPGEAVSLGPAVIDGLRISRLSIVVPGQ